MNTRQNMKGTTLKLMMESTSLGKLNCAKMHATNSNLVNASKPANFGKIKCKTFNLFVSFFSTAKQCPKKLI